MSPIRILAAALAVAALSAPAAHARPADLPASTAPIAGTQSARQDLRSPDAIDAATGHHAATRVLPGPPTWPSNPQPISTQAATSNDGGGIDTLTIALGILGSVIVVLAVTATVERSRRRKHRHAIA